MNIPVQRAGKFSTRHTSNIPMTEETDENVSKGVCPESCFFRPIRAHYSFFPPIRAHLLLTFLQSVLTFCLFSSNQCSLFPFFLQSVLTFCSSSRVRAHFLLGFHPLTYPSSEVCFTPLHILSRS